MSSDPVGCGGCALPQEGCIEVSCCLFRQPPPPPCSRAEQLVLMRHRTRASGNHRASPTCHNDVERQGIVFPYDRLEMEAPNISVTSKVSQLENEFRICCRKGRGAFSPPGHTTSQGTLAILPSGFRPCSATDHIILRHLASVNGGSSPS